MKSGRLFILLMISFSFRVLPHKITSAYIVLREQQSFYFSTKNNEQFICIVKQMGKKD